MSDQVFTRDGHLLELAIERYLLDELDDAALVDEHVAGCDACAQLLASFREDRPLPPFWDPIELSDAPDLAPVEPANDPAGVSIWKVASIVGLLAAALLVGVLLPTEPEFETRGGQLELQVYRHDGAQGEAVSAGDLVRAGDRLGFRLASGRGGHAMVLGLDEAGSIYPCWPQPEGVSVLLDPMTEPTTLPTAVRLDDTPGTETIVAMVCDEAFTFGHAADALAEGIDRPGCEAVEVTLEKE